MVTTGLGSVQLLIKIFVAPYMNIVPTFNPYIPTSSVQNMPSVSCKFKYPTIELLQNLANLLHEKFFRREFFF